MKLTPITNPLALRLDTTVGTRIFAGDTMIHGDTGWRDVSSLLMNGWTGTVWIRRKGDQLFWRFFGLDGTGATDNQLLPGFPGFTAINSGSVSMTYVNRIIAFTIAWTAGGSTLSTADRGTIAGELSFHTMVSWPVTLPGLPV